MTMRDWMPEPGEKVRWAQGKTQYQGVIVRSGQHCMVDVTEGPTKGDVAIVPTSDLARVDWKGYVRKTGGTD